MHNFDEMIEKYRHELMEFSKQAPSYEFEEERKLVPVSTAVVRQDESYDSGIEDTIILKPYKDEDDFRNRNGSSGLLKVQVFAADRSFPIADSDVSVFAVFRSGEKELYRGKTDEDGIVDNISLPAPNKSLSLDEDNTSEPFALYKIRVSHPDFATGEYSNVPVFSTIKSIQPVELVPLTQSGDEPGKSEFGGER